MPENKTIGILTFHRPINYGAFLQAYSLSAYLQKRYPACRVEIIDYIAPAEQKKIYKNALRALKHDGWRAFFRECRKIQVFHKSVKALPLSPSIGGKGLSALFRYIAARYDAVLVGSDAVLNWNQNGYPSAFYLNYDFQLPMFMYAASVHGMDYERISEEQKQAVGQAFARFALFGVRDRNTERFIAQYREREVITHTCDPTVFIDIRQCREKAGSVRERLLHQYGFDMEKPYIALMLNDDVISRRVKEAYGDRYKLVSLFKTNRACDCFLYDLNPFEWVEVLAGSALTVTQYFHAALLSLRHCKAPVVVDKAKNTDRFESKLHDLMIVRFELPALYFADRDLQNDLAAFSAACETVLREDFTEQIERALARETASMEQFMARLDNDIQGKAESDE